MKKLYFLLLPLTGISFGTSAQLEYKDVAPIFYSHCASCHHLNGGAPFSLTGYSETYSWKASIQNDLQIGKMPPWPPDTAYTRFLHERIITQSEKNDILNWISAGAPAGDTTQAPAPPAFPQYQLYGTPDAVIQIPTFTSNATNFDSYVCFCLPMGLTQDRILRAYEIIPGNAAIVHHVVVTIDTAGTATSDLSGSCFTQPGDFGIGGYAPGAGPTVFPSQAPLKTGIRIKSTSKIVMQIHYPLGTAGQDDSTQIRLYFYPVNETGVRPVHVETILQNWNLVIPPGTVQTFTAQVNNPSPVSILAAFPHSHKVCTKIVNYAYTSTDTIPIVRVNKWDFNWQAYYTFPNLVKIPAGYKLFSKHTYDNTTNNLNNPNSPPQLVTAGTSTTDEMLFDSFQWLDYLPGDENIDIGSILANDTLLSPTYAGQYLPVAEITSFAYPNPFSEKVRIGYELASASEVSIVIYNIYGSRVRNISSRFEAKGAHTIDWDGKNDAGANVPAGVYFYSINTGKSVSSGKVMLMQR